MSAPFTSAGPGTARRAGSAAFGVVIAAAVLAPAAHAAQHFESRPDITPPSVRVTTKPTRTAPGLIFVAPKQGNAQRGPMIYDEAGNLVYFRPVPKGTTVLDFRAQTYQGKPVLTWWQGKAERGFGFGSAVIFDQAYRQIATVRAGNGQRMDFHEFNLTPQGTALAGAYKLMRQDTTGAKNGEKHDRTLQNVVQEIDVKTGKVLFEWNANRHIPPSESYEVVPDRVKLPYDYIHINSINLDTDGNLLISARATSTVYKVNRKTGKIMWRLGGKKSNFKLGKGAHFRFQHDALRQADGTITIFDNNADEPVPGRQSRGIQLRVNASSRKATLVRQYKNPKPQLSASQGNIQTLPNRNVFIGWGGNATNVTEFSRSGAVRFEARFTERLVDTYRAYRFPWAGQPTELPRAVAARSGNTTTVRVSWNGATTVAAWRVLGGPSPTALQARSTGPRTGFETQLRYEIPDAVVAVEALDAQGNVLSRSNPVAIG